MSRRPTSRRAAGHDRDRDTERATRRSTRPACRPTLGTLTLQVPGRHNLQNALAAVAVGLGARAVVRAGRGRPAGVPRRRAALRRSRRAERHPGRRRLRPSPDRDRRGARGRAVARAADRRRLSAASLHADGVADGRVRSGARRRRPHRADRHLAAGEDPIPGVTLDALAAAVRRSVTVPVDVVPRLDDVVPAVVRDRAQPATS